LAKLTSSGKQTGTTNMGKKLTYSIFITTI